MRTSALASWTFFLTYSFCLCRPIRFYSIICLLFSLASDSNWALIDSNAALSFIFYCLTSPASASLFWVISFPLTLTPLVEISFLAFVILRALSSSDLRFCSSCIRCIKTASLRCYSSYICLVFFLVSSIFLIALTSSYWSILTLFLSCSTSL